MGPAFVTGGSSGIGLALCEQLATEGRDLAIFARDTAKLGAARELILARAPDTRIFLYAADVSDRYAMGEVLDDAVQALGPPEIAIASAGIAEPGLFLHQPLDSHDRQMAVNYGGSLFFAHHLAPEMKKAGGGRIGFIASGAAFFGIHGYSAYAPSKFALRGLAEVLRVELAPHGIGVSICFPPDTDTPQLEAEARTKPEATKAITAGGGLWRAEDVAAAMLKGMARNRFDITPGLQMSALNRLASLVAPALRSWQGRVIRKAGDL
ncbi:SDR family oxidoreductase [Shimia biformata]|uniref:SDR family oxidoreductase n=1 Tax=Shimia biformata TaxID=1294299 RepID=UPI0019508CFD|nr:SDR family oxidoreductase [Shimia biformata]